MGERRKYRRKAGTRVTAVRIDLDLVAFTYRKWGHENRAEPGDWILNNAGDVYTVKAAEFDRTYRTVSPGVYEKVVGIWAREAEATGTVETLEGKTDYVAGDFLVYDHEDGPPRYAISATKFHEMYEREEGE